MAYSAIKQDKSSDEYNENVCSAGMSFPLWGNILYPVQIIVPRCFLPIETDSPEDRFGVPAPCFAAIDAYLRILLWFGLRSLFIGSQRHVTSLASE
ncbi:hypothetical protein AVEN_116565-1 [Araneus ventricosus]|uniref:Uncharacterized protein n=1 Tax=Araneus ventricosus TaxID=182803 RepID=A0A4Y2NJA5_ARAVE|nr:hypothetical protein AVEN_116565-1 [Araneus ventricosus]